MPEYILVCLLLLAQVILDATGDWFRTRGWGILHHAMEAIQIGGWLLIWALFGFKIVYVYMYILGRVWAFDIVYNIWHGGKLLYVGKFDLLGKAIRWLAEKTKQPYVHFSFTIKFIALIWWTAWLFTNGGYR